MHKKIASAALAALWSGAWTGTACAANVDRYEIPYFTAAGEYVLTDSKRAADNGLGYALGIGVPLADPHNAVELRFFDRRYERHSDGRDNYQTGLAIDYVRDFGTLFLGLKPYAALGLGLIQEDVKAEKHLYPGLTLGGGVLLPLGHRGIALRLDARAQAQSNHKSAPGASSLLDEVVSIGVELPLTWFYDKPMTATPAAEACPVAVVDAESGRSDCAIDTDNDGVYDTTDECPATPAGAEVDSNGCAKPEPLPPGDEDKDGVSDARDQCPGTPTGLAVNEKGCVVAQKSALGGVTFLENSPELTDEGRATLDAVAATLRVQANLKVEIAGHTDSVGSEAFNTLLSQQRAEAVRAYLIGLGIEENRMTAVGYGELEPVATNDTEEGRKANRRVEFRITTE